MRIKAILGFILACGLLVGGLPLARAAETPEQDQEATSVTPPRLGFVDGQVSYFRPGAQDWVAAQVNTPLAPGDQLSTGSPGNFELQVGARAFVRGWANTQIGLENHDPDFLQFMVTAGHVSLDLRTLGAGQTVEVDTPNAAITIEHQGYYRLDITGERTSLIARRSGQATLIPASGEAVAIAPSEEVVIEGSTSPQVASYAAPALDDWDKWNYARTDALLDAVSARYVPPGTYGVDDLDHYGTWRVVPTYGSVWVPTAVQAGWVPYSTGSWVLDPVYGWTWVDTAPWGWAPFHYGRWVFVDGFWAWAPGPVVARPVYSPALVAFFGEPSVSVGVAVGGLAVGWVALGWGEPCVPWWGRPGFIHTPWWGGWGGPRVVNNVIVNKTTVVNVQNITMYQNTSVRNGLVVVHENRFGHGPITSARIAQADVRNFHPIHTAPQIAAAPTSFVPTTGRGIRPPQESLRRPVVATRPPHQVAAPGGAARTPGPAGAPAPPPHIVSLPQPGGPATTLPRAPFGRSTVERPAGSRLQPPLPPRIERPQQPEQGRERTQPGKPGAGPKPGGASPGASTLTPTAPAQAPRQATPPPSRPETPRPQASRQAPPSPQPPQRPQISERGPAGPPPVARQAPPQPRPEPQAARPSPATPSPQARRAEAPRAPAHPLPGEAASHLAPNRGKAEPPRRVEQKAAPPRGRPEAAPGNSSQK